MLPSPWDRPRPGGCSFAPASCRSLLKCTAAWAATSPPGGAGAGGARRLPARQRGPLSPAGRMQAALDWKLCKLSDPLAAVVTAPRPPSWPVDHHLEGANFDADFGGTRPRSDGDDDNDEDGDNPDPRVTWADLLERVGDLHNLSTRERQQGPDPVDQPWSAPSLFVPSVGEVRFEGTRARICGEQSQSAHEPGPRTLAEAPRRERPDLAGTGRSGRPHDLGGPE